jgi:hypothetical protein
MEQIGIDFGYFKRGIYSLCVAGGGKDAGKCCDTAHEWNG